jgi:hypothetical protein
MERFRTSPPASANRHGVAGVLPLGPTTTVILLATSSLLLPLEPATGQVM